MATILRKTDPSVVDMAAAFNDLKAFCMAELRLAQADVATIAADSDVGVTPTFVSLGSHNDKSEVSATVADPDDGDDDDGLAGAIALTNELLAVYKFHMSDTLAHKTTGVALASYVPVKTLANAITRANDIKSKYETHRASTTYHYVADSTHTISATNANDLPSLITLVTELKADINDHMASGPSTKSLRVVDA